MRQYIQAFLFLGFVAGVFLFTTYRLSQFNTQISKELVQGFAGTRR